MAGGDLLIGAVGDVFLDREDPSHAFDPVLPIFREVDLLIGNCEGAFTDGQDFSPSATWRVASPTRNAEVLGPAGFHVMTCANNHTLDAGYSGMADTLEAMRRQGIATAGAGDNLDEANIPARLERNGTRVAVTAHSSVYQPGYPARTVAPGIATVRVHSHYYIPEWDDYGRIEPGVRPHVRTFPYPEDMQRLSATIHAARSDADVVVATFHWGSAAKRSFLNDYEKEIARAAIDSGADIVFGHHHHFLRGIEFYKGRPIFYGLGHFVFDLKWVGEKLTPSEIANSKNAYGDYAIYPREGYPLLPFHADGRLTMIALVRMDGGRTRQAGFMPCVIDPSNRAFPADPESTEGKAVLDYVRLITDEADLPTDYAFGETLVGGVRPVIASPRD